MKNKGDDGLDFSIFDKPISGVRMANTYLEKIIAVRTIPGDNYLYINMLYLMRKVLTLAVFALLIPCLLPAQENPFDRLSFLIGEWKGTGSGFGNRNSTIQSSFQTVMNENYIEVINESWFDPTENNPGGEHHVDKGFISYDKDRKAIVFRQFNIEGYINQYVLNDSLSSENVIVFETENIENFVPGGSARWTINILDKNEIETVFDVSFSGKEYSCFGTNHLTRAE